MRMMFVLLAGACVIAPIPALAQQITPLLDTRLRYETVDQNGLDRTANALTLRVRGGAEFTSGDWKLLAEGEATVPLDEVLRQRRQPAHPLPTRRRSGEWRDQPLAAAISRDFKGRRHGRPPADQPRRPALRRRVRLATE